MNIAPVAVRSRPPARLLGGAAAAAAAAVWCGSARANITIVPTFDASISASSDAATIEGTINSLIAAYESRITTPISVSIDFKADESVGLGQSETYITTLSYTNYRAALVTHATSADDATALAHLPVSTNNPVTGTSPDVGVTLPLSRALGYAASSGTYDSTIKLKTSLMNLSRTGTTDPSKYDLYAVAAHEVDEVLGTSSDVGDTSGQVNAADLFRYAAGGARSFTTSSAVASYFSLDGTTDLARYNQTAGADYGDWYSPGGQTPQVQDAFGTPGSAPDLGVEYRVLDAVGYNLAAVPEPTTLAAAAAVGAVGLLARRRRPRSA